MKTFHIRLSQDNKAFMFISAYATILVFLISPDSFTHDLFTCCDTPIFFMCGKAWMNGMIPYVDFTDSKGPLLWLIQGIGYLISNYTYVGVFLLQCLFYSVTFCYVYKTATLFIKRKEMAILCASFMALVYFNPWYHYEIKSEDWCQPFLIVSIYHICRLFYTGHALNNSSIYQTAYILGICWTGPLLIKYSIAIMMGSLLLAVLIFLIKQKKNPIIPILLFHAGVLTVFTPFAVYFLAIGNFDDFIREYFVRTFETIDESNTTSNYIHEVLLTTADTRYALMFFSNIIGCLMFSRMVSRFRYFPLVSFCFFWFISIHHLTSYYYLTCNFSFSIFLIVACIKNIEYKKFNNIKKTVTITATILVMFLTFWNYTFTDGYLLSNLFFFNNSYRHTYYKAASVLSQVKNPKIVYLDCAIHGWETPVNGLPGSTYYNTQYGETTEMRSRKMQDITHHIPDFICMEEDHQEKDALNTLNLAGYRLCYDFHWWNHHFFFYTKHPSIKPPLEDIKVSAWDVLFKRRIFQ